MLQPNLYDQPRRCFMQDFEPRLRRRRLTPAGRFWLLYLAVASVVVLTGITLGYHDAVMRAL